MDEFIMVADFKNAAREFTATGWDDAKADDFTEHLRSLGVEDI